MTALNTLEIYRELHPSFNEEQTKKLVAVLSTVATNIREDTERRQFDKLAAKEDILELKTVVFNLAKAQEKTEKELQKLTKAVVHLQSEVGGLSNRFGYILEDRAIKTLPRLLKQDFDIEIKTMIRDCIEYDEKHFDEINILGYGQKDKKDILVIGEAKYQLANKHIHQFLVMLDRIKTVKKESLFPLFVCASADPSVRKYAEGLGIKLYFSYQLDL